MMARDPSETTREQRQRIERERDRGQTTDAQAQYNDPNGVLSAGGERRPGESDEEFKRRQEREKPDHPHGGPPGQNKPEPREGDEAAPKDAIDAQHQGHVEEAEDAAKAAEQNARAAEQRLAETRKRQEEQVAAQEQANKDQPEVQRFTMVNPPSDVVSVSGPRNIPMETTEEDRLLRHKAMVRDHLRNADPDMTGGVGTPTTDPATGLPMGHVPEGHQDAVMVDGGRDPDDDKGPPTRPARQHPSQHV